jgi:ATP-dependent Clp protease ATP-binding subunit ClpA
MAILIAEKAIRKFEEKLMAKNIKVSVTDACYRWLAGKGLSSTYGAREIQRVVQDQIVTCFVNEVLFGKLTKGGSAVIDVVEDKISVSVEEG